MNRRTVSKAHSSGVVEFPLDQTAIADLAMQRGGVPTPAAFLPEALGRAQERLSLHELIRVGVARQEDLRLLQQVSDMGRHAPPPSTNVLVIANSLHFWHGSMGDGLTVWAARLKCLSPETLCCTPPEPESMPSAPAGCRSECGLPSARLPARAEPMHLA